jgi:hypothetical protein
MLTAPALGIVCPLLSELPKLMRIIRAARVQSNPIAREAARTLCLSVGA